MVSFSCDECQDVVSRRKVDGHMRRCGGRTVSCIDCLERFTKSSVVGHTSCISEGEKYGPKHKQDTGEVKKCTQGYCGVCSLKLNGSVDAVQHYDSRKHRAAVRKQNQEIKKLKTSKHQEEKQDKGHVGMLKLKGAMKKVLKRNPRQRMKRAKLVDAVAVMLGQNSPENLEDLVDVKVKKSWRFESKKGRVYLVNK